MEHPHPEIQNIAEPQELGPAFSVVDKHTQTYEKLLDQNYSQINPSYAYNDSTIFPKDCWSTDDDDDDDCDNTTLIIMDQKSFPQPFPVENTPP